MHVLLHELRKIWTPAAVLALVVASALYYWFFIGAMGGPISRFPNSSQGECHLELALEWRERFGVAIEADELAFIEADLQAAHREFAREVAGVPGAADEGVTSWETFAAFQERVRTELDRLSVNGVTHIEPGSELARLNALQSEVLDLPSAARIYEVELLLSGQSESLGGSDGAHTPEQESQGYLSPMWLQDLEAYAARLATWLVVAPAFVAAPFAMRDRLCRIRPAQWASRTGRGIFTLQFAAMALSVVAVLAVTTVAWLLPFCFTDVPDLLECMLVGPMSGYECWWDMTFGSYIAARLALMLALGCASGLASFLLARASSGYVGMLLRLVPWCSGMGFVVAPALLDHALCARVGGYGIGALLGGAAFPGFDALVVVVVCALAFAICGVSCLRQMHGDL